MTRRATVLPDDVEWVVTTLTRSLERLGKQPDYIPHYRNAQGEVVVITRAEAPPTFALSRRQLVEEIGEYLTERMRHG